jgi:hypothetical protein
MPAADMSEIVTPLPSVMSRLPILFDETGAEQVVGWCKYSNGPKKPVYQKTVKATPTLAGVEIASNVDTFINAPRIIRIYESGSSFIITDCGMTNNNWIAFKLDNDVLYVASISSKYDSGEATVTIQYTKTTDTPV